MKQCVKRKGLPNSQSACNKEKHSGYQENLDLDRCQFWSKAWMNIQDWVAVGYVCLKGHQPNLLRNLNQVRLQAEIQTAQQGATWEEEHKEYPSVPKSLQTTLFVKSSTVLQHKATDVVNLWNLEIRKHCQHRDTWPDIDSNIFPASTKIRVIIRVNCTSPPTNIVSSRPYQ